MSDMKCPFCQQELRCDNTWNEVYMCRNPNCNHLLGYGTKELWQALIDTKKKLDICKSALEKISLGNIPSLPDDETLALAMCNYARDTLEQIKDKEE